MKSFIPRILLFLLLILLGYYFFFLKPQLILPQTLFKAKISFTLHRTNLLQNRLALIELARLNPNNPNRDQERTQLLSQLQTANQQGLINIKSQPATKNLPEFSQALAHLLTHHQTLLQDQQTLADQLTQIDSFSAQLELLESPNTITLLTDQTNLILEYDHWLKKIDQQLEKLPLQSLLQLP